MALLFTISDVKEYKAQTERQKEVLKLSLVFNDEEKQQVATIYDELIEICDTILSKEIKVSNPATL